MSHDELRIGSLLIWEKTSSVFYVYLGQGFFLYFDFDSNDIDVIGNESTIQGYDSC